MCIWNMSDSWFQCHNLTHGLVLLWKKIAKVKTYKISFKPLFYLSYDKSRSALMGYPLNIENCRAQFVSQLYLNKVGSLLPQRILSHVLSLVLKNVYNDLHQLILNFNLWILIVLTHRLALNWSNRTFEIKQKIKKYYKLQN